MYPIKRGDCIADMFHVFAYKDKSGNSPIMDYLHGLDAKSDKDSRINANKIYDYIDYLRSAGRAAKEPYEKHLEGEIWELRPVRNRILYAAWNSSSFILLHIFMKDTQKTPRREIEQAKRNLSDIRERGLCDEQ